MVLKPAFDPWMAAQGSQPGPITGIAGARQAAQQFEALLIRQFLSNARSTSWLSDQQETESGWREIADDALAGYLVKAGGLGLSKQVESLLIQAQKQRLATTNQAGLKDARQGVVAAPLNALGNSTVTLTRHGGQGQPRLSSF